MIVPPPIFPPSASGDDRRKAVRTLIADLKQDTRPILLGPWRSELGFEVLYWMPFLRWLSTQVPRFDQRACVVTRGGLAPLYAGVASRGYDLYALRSVQDVRRENLADYKKTAMQKQVAQTDWDVAVLTEAAAQMGLGPVFQIVHPAWMYWALSPFWEDHAGMHYLAEMTTYERLPTPPRPAGLPEQYVAVKFYGRATFPYPEPEIAQFIQRVCGILSANLPVVCVTAGGAYDDHVDVSLAGPRVTMVPPVSPELNLYQQAQIMAHATAVVGTYGGAVQLALRMGVPTVSFWKDWGGTAVQHVNLSRWLGTTMQVPFLAQSISEIGLLQQVVMPPIVQMMPQAAHAG